MLGKGRKNLVMKHHFNNNKFKQTKHQIFRYKIPFTKSTMRRVDILLEHIDCSQLTNRHFKHKKLTHFKYDEKGTFSTEKDMVKRFSTIKKLFLQY